MDTVMTATLLAPVTLLLTATVMLKKTEAGSFWNVLAFLILITETTVVIAATALSTVST